MERHVSAKVLEERDPVTDQDGQNRVAYFVGYLKAKALRGDRTSSNEPNAVESGAQTPIHELCEIARVELDGVPHPRQRAAREHEGGRVAVRPAQPFGLESQRGLIRSRSHDVAIDRLEERLDESKAPSCL